jgi:hypothetical protein
MKLSQHASDVLRVILAAAVVIFLWFFLASWPVRGISIKSLRAEAISQPLTLAQLGTYGDMFGALTCLFTGLGFVGAGYAVVLQLRQLRHQQEEMERNECNRIEAEKAREVEAKKTAASEHTTAMLNAACFLAQTYATKLASFPPEMLSHTDRVGLEERRTQRNETAL